MAADRYPTPKSPRREPWYRLEYERTRRRILADTSDRRPKFKIFELVAAFLTMRRREAGIDARVCRVEAHAFEIQTLQGLLHYIPKKDPDHVRMRESIAVLLKNNGDPKLGNDVHEIFEQFEKKKEGDFSKAQSLRGKKKQLDNKCPLNDYIDEVLKEDSGISAKNLSNRIEKDAGREGHPADYIHRVTDDEIIARDPVTGKKYRTDRKYLDKRLSRRKTIFRNKSCQPG